MKDSDKIKNSLIDEFYNEAQEELNKNEKYSDEYREFKNKLNNFFFIIFKINLTHIFLISELFYF